MSERKQPVMLSSRAMSDLEDILAYTESTWGNAAADDYSDALEGSLRAIEQYPHMGTLRNDLLEGARMLVVRHHLVVYRLEPELIRVLRIVHERTNLYRLRLDDVR